MLKKWITGICALLFILSVAIASSAELDVIDETEDDIRTVIYYIPASNNANVLTTAKMVAKTIVSCWNERDIYAAKYVNKQLQQITKSNEDKALAGIIQQGNDNGAKPLASNAYKQLPDAANDIWFIVPEEARQGFINNSDLMNTCDELLQNKSSRMHIVFIGEDVFEIPGDCALSNINQGEKVEWKFIVSDFLQESLPQNTNGELHTGNYLIASLYGSPADLTVTQSSDGNSWNYELPESMNVFILIKWENASGIPEFKNEADKPINSEDISIFSVSEPGYAILTGAMLGKMEAGKYSVTDPENSIQSVRVYWYPDLNEINPEIITTDNWKVGDNELLLKLNKQIWKSDQDILVQFAYRYNNETDEPTKSIVTYNAEKEGWAKKISVSSREVEHVYVIPSVRINMADGNEIWSWTGERRAYDVVSQGIKPSSNVPDSINVYIDSESGETGSVYIQYKNIFVFNPNEELDFSVTLNSTEKEPGIKIKETDKEGFTIESVNGDELADTCTIIVTGNLHEKDNEKKDGDKAKLEIQFVRRDINTLWDFSITSDEEGQEIRAGNQSQIDISAKLTEETFADWEEACDQNLSFPKPESLVMVCNIEGEGPERSEPLTGEEGKLLKGNASLEIPGETKAGEKEIRITIRQEGSERILASKTFSVHVLNGPPRFNQYVEAEDNEETKGRPLPEEITLEGFPWDYKTIENLLEKYFGDSHPFNYGLDDEGALTSVTITIDNVEGLKFPLSTEGNAEDEWTCKVFDKEDDIKIDVVGPGEHTITLKAQDGTDDETDAATDHSVVIYSGKVKIYSEVLRYTSYAAAGLAVLLILLIAVRVIVHMGKPSFDGILLRLFASSDEEQERSIELMSKSEPVSMSCFKKKGVPLETLMVLARQPAMDEDCRKVIEDIALFPAKHKGLNIVFGKEAKKTIGRHEKKETVALGDSFRMRIGNEYILIENVQADD